MPTSTSEVSSIRLNDPFFVIHDFIDRILRIERGEDVEKDVFTELTSWIVNHFRSWFPNNEYSGHFKESGKKSYFMLNEIDIARLNTAFEMLCEESEHTTISKADMVRRFSEWIDAFEQISPDSPIEEIKLFSDTLSKQLRSKGFPQESDFMIGSISEDDDEFTFRRGTIKADQENIERWTR